MMDLIDREELLDALHNRLCNPKTPEQSPGIAAAEKLVKKQPAIEPKRGSWINTTLEWVNDVKFVLAECSECGNRSVMDMEQLNDTIKFARNFCPNCGADMRFI